MDVPSIKYVEDTIRGRLVEMMNEIIKEENLPLVRADAQVEKTLPDGTSRKFPDIVIWKTVLLSPVCQIELKDPTKGWSPFDLALVEDAEQKANLPPTSPFYATWNINELVLWKTYEEGALSWEDKKKAIYKFVKIKELRDLDDPEVQAKIKEVIRVFLNDLIQFLESKKELPTIPIDEFFINSLGTIVDASYYSIALKTREEFKKDKKFRESLTNWFVSQGWVAPVTDDIDAFEKVARQFLYLLLNKIMFYNTLRKNFPSLEPIKIKGEIEEGETLKKDLQRYFEKAEEVTKDFEAIFSYDFLERIPIPKEVVPSLKSFINGFSKYDFSKLEYKDIGHIFDRLIPNDERHKLGQYFTDPDVVDIINTFCIKTPNDKIADFGCGAGTFLVRAYARIKYLSPDKQHGEILKQLIGVDISKFAAHLTMINLTARDLSKIENPIVICKDFFDIYPSRYENWGEIRGESLKKEDIKVEIPAELDAVVGNPPYTRQEELEEYIENYKDKLQQTIKADWDKNIKLNKRAGIYAYFFVHGLRFLKDGGRFGYITSNSWLDADYGKDLQEFLLKHSKIIAIIETKERIFPDADINTVIAILEKCNDEKERNNNLVKFVKLKISLKELIPYTNDKKRFDFLENLVKLIENTKTLYEDKNLRIYPKLQVELWDEGYDEKEKKYIGSKWGKYTRVAVIFFKILDKEKGKLFSLGQIYRVRKGYMRTPYKAFCLNQEIINKYKIENKFLKPVFSIAKSAKYVYMSKNKLEKLLIVNKSLKDLKGTHLLQYIRYAEEKYPELKKVRNWWQLKKREPGQLVVVRTPFDRHVVMLNDIDAYVYDHNEIVVNTKYAKSLCAILNSTLYILFREVF
ncbi:MAG: N-6 DNA methylase, partial [Thermoproteota archaeon]